VRAIWLNCFVRRCFSWASLKNWLAVLNWGSSILAVPKWRGKRHNITSFVKKRIASFPNSVAHNQVISTRSHNKPASSSLAQAVSAKLEDGNLRAAIKIICSDDSPAQPTGDALQKLREKQPPASVGLDDLPDICRTQLCRLPNSKCARQSYLSQPVPRVDQLACVPNISKIYDAMS